VDCYICNEIHKPNVFSRRCEKHDVCDECGKTRKEIKGTPWGTRKGFICGECQERIWNKRIDDFSKKEVEDYEFSYNDKIKCPYCGYEYIDDELHESSDDETCPNCNSGIKVEVDWTASYSTEK